MSTRVNYIKVKKLSSNMPAWQRLKNHEGYSKALFGFSGSSYRLTKTAIYQENIRSKWTTAKNSKKHKCLDVGKLLFNNNSVAVALTHFRWSIDTLILISHISIGGNKSVFMLNCRSIFYCATFVWKHVDNLQFTPSIIIKLTGLKNWQKLFCNTKQFIFIIQYHILISITYVHQVTI